MVSHWSQSPAVFLNFEYDLTKIGSCKLSCHVPKFEKVKCQLVFYLEFIMNISFGSNHHTAVPPTFKMAATPLRVTQTDRERLNRTDSFGD